MIYGNSIATDYAASRMATESPLSSRLLRSADMTRKAEQIYFAKRVAAERAAALAATHPAAKAIHVEMAQGYAMMVLRVTRPEDSA